jgi:hypothetical protein
MPKLVYAKQPRKKTGNVMIRMPEDILIAAHELAAKEHRSLQGQIMHLLENWMAQARPCQDRHPVASATP